VVARVSVTAPEQVPLRSGSVAPVRCRKPASNAEVTVNFAQRIGAGEPLRTGAYSGTVTLALSTTTP